MSSGGFNREEDAAKEPRFEVSIAHFLEYACALTSATNTPAGPRCAHTCRCEETLGNGYDHAKFVYVAGRRSLRFQGMSCLRYTFLRQPVCFRLRATGLL